MRFNPAAILAALERHGVRYLLIGGLAANAHGVRRTTRDVDIVVERTRDNLERLAAVARELEVPDDLARASNVTLDTREGELDVMNDAAGDLIALKDAAGRDVDRRDIADLSDR